MRRRLRAVTPELIARTLRSRFRLRQLREGQEQVIGRVLNGRSTLALMPTGAGKSLCYQLPALLLDGVTVVISPLISLMKDQCDALRELGIASVELHSGLTRATQEDVRGRLARGEAPIVFTTPEQLEHPELVELLAKRGVALLVVDEAHCLSQWGFDFRPAFLGLGAALQALGRPTVLALTATATEQVVDDIVSVLDIPRAGVIGTGLFRPNLHYRAEHFSRGEDKLARLVEIVRGTPGSGIVYAATVTGAEAVHEAIVAAGEPAELYHGRLGAGRRRAAQDAFMGGECRVMVATNAFGLGIDKPDIRFVVHHQAPAGLDAYYQESGRAGRDGQVSQCALLFVEGDTSVQQFFLSGRYPKLNDFRAVLVALGQEAPGGDAGWTLDSLGDALGGSRRKLAAVVHVLRRHGVVRSDQEGRLDIVSSPDEQLLTELEAACADKATRDRSMLERMVAYAQSGQCRWKMLLESLEGVPLESRCRTCDNCLRLAAFEQAAEAARLEEEAAERNAGAVGATRADAGTVQHLAPALTIGDRVRTRRHGPAVVVARDALSVTVRFDNGETRTFQPQFLVPMARGGRRAATQREAA